jgi:putative tricarboxylic transport membrane protein
MVIGNVMLFILNVQFIQVWVRLLSVPYSYLIPLIIVLCAGGAYSARRSIFDLYMILFFGAIGFVLVKAGFELSSFILGLILGPFVEKHLRTALVLGDGDPIFLFTSSWIGGGIWLFGAVLILVSAILRRRDKQFLGPADGELIGGAVLPEDGAIPALAEREMATPDTGAPESWPPESGPPALFPPSNEGKPPD